MHINLSPINGYPNNMQHTHKEIGFPEVTTFGGLSPEISEVRECSMNDMRDSFFS